MSDSVYLWNIGTDQNPVIQGQAGKPFYHAPGDTVYLPHMDIPVNNSCLCQYPYMQYFRVFAKLVHRDHLIFLNYSDSQLSQFSDSGWQWQLHQFSDSSYYLYAGCMPSQYFTGHDTFTRQAVGVWQDLKSQVVKDPQTGLYNMYHYPYPSKENIALKKNSAAISQLTKLYIPQQRRYIVNTGTSTVKCMLVCSYVPCNGQEGYGVSDSDQYTYFSDSQEYTYQFYYKNGSNYNKWNVSSVAGSRLPYGVYYPSNPAKQGQHTSREVFVFPDFTSTRGPQYQPYLYTARKQGQEKPSVYPSPCDYDYTAELCQKQPGIYSQCFWDSRASLTPPCNIPDPPPYKYRQYTSDNFNQQQNKCLEKIRFIKYSAGRYKITVDQRSDSYNGCFCQMTEQSSPSIQILAQNVTDIQLLQSGLYEKCYYGLVQQPDGWYKYSFWESAGSQPIRFNTSDFSISRLDGQCPVYFCKVVPYQKCGCRFPDSDSMSQRQSLPVAGYRYPYNFNVFDWYRLGYLTQQQLSGIELNTWTVANLNNIKDIAYIIEAPPATRIFCDDQLQSPIQQFKDYTVYGIQELDYKKSWQNKDISQLTEQDFRPLKLVQKTVKAVFFYCDLDADADWDDSILGTWGATTQEKQQCLNNRNKQGTGSFTNPFKNLSWAIQQISGALTQKRSNKVPADCAVWVVLKCTGQAHYSVGWHSFAYRGNIIIQGAHIKINSDIPKILASVNCAYNCTFQMEGYNRNFSDIFHADGPIWIPLSQYQGVLYNCTFKCDPSYTEWNNFNIEAHNCISCSFQGQYANIILRNAASCSFNMSDKAYCSLRVNRAVDCQFIRQPDIVNSSVYVGIQECSCNCSFSGVFENSLSGTFFATIQFTLSQDFQSAVNVVYSCYGCDIVIKCPIIPILTSLLHADFASTEEKIFGIMNSTIKIQSVNNAAYSVIQCDYIRSSQVFVKLVADSSPYIMDIEYLYDSLVQIQLLIPEVILQPQQQAYADYEIKCIRANSIKNTQVTLTGLNSQYEGYDSGNITVISIINPGYSVQNVSINVNNFHTCSDIFGDSQILVYGVGGNITFQWAQQNTSNIQLTTNNVQTRHTYTPQEGTWYTLTRICTVYSDRASQEQSFFQSYCTCSKQGVDGNLQSFSSTECK